MNLNLVWIIYKAKSKNALEESLLCFEKLHSKGIEVIKFESGIDTNQLKSNIYVETQVA